MATNNAINLGRATFIANTSYTYTNVTGEAQPYFVIFDTAAVNEGSCYTPSTGKFNAPVTGNYLFNTTITFGGITSNMNTGQLYFISYDSPGSFTALVLDFEAYNWSYNGILTVSASYLAAGLPKGNGVRVEVIIYGGYNVVSVYNSFFSG